MILTQEGLDEAVKITKAYARWMEAQAYGNEPGDFPGVPTFQQMMLLVKAIEFAAPVIPPEGIP